MLKPYLEKSVARFVNNLNNNTSKPIYELSPQQAREVLLSVQTPLLQNPHPQIKELDIPLSSGRTMKTQIIYPSQFSHNLPVIFYIHGGGWVMGNEITHQHLIYDLALKTPAAVVFPIYTPSPEAQYPQTTQDLFSALQYLQQIAEEYNLNLNNLCVAGDSVGGNMATVMALMAKQSSNTPKIKFQLLLYPVTSSNFNTKSYQEYADGPWLTQKAMEWFWQQYAPDLSSRQEIYASPLHAKTEDLQDLPTTLIITDENDVLRDEGEAYAHKLNNAGVEVYSVRINGTIHDFMMLNALAESSPTQIAMDISVTYLQKFLYPQSAS